MPTEFITGLLFLLLPVAAASGWIAGRKKYLKSSTSYVDEVAPEYYKGLRYLINEQPDKAIEVFLRLLEVDKDTVEVHLALGNLFRRRGEVDRAIRIHQNLIARPVLSNEQRAQSLLELGVDYLRSGLLDRAEDFFRGLLDTTYRTRAARYLVEIYEAEMDWDKAMECARIWLHDDTENLNRRIAHYYCHKAEEKFGENDLKTVRQFLKQALKQDPDSVHVSLLEGRLEMEEENYRAAIRAFRRIEKQNPEFIGEVLNDMKRCYRELDRTQDFLEYLHQLPSSETGVNHVIEMSDLIQENEGVESAIRFLVGRIEQLPSAKMLDRLVDLSLLTEDDHHRSKLKCFKRLTEKLVEVGTTYKCNYCGYNARKLYWQCPGCKHWDTVKPVRGTTSE